MWCGKKKYESLPGWDKEKTALNLEILERDVLELCLLNDDLILEDSIIWTCSDIVSALASHYKNTCNGKEYCKRHSALNTAIHQLIRSPSFQERVKVLRRNIQWLSAEPFWSPELLRFDYEKLRRAILKGIELVVDEKVFLHVRLQDISVGPLIIFRDVPVFLTHFLCEEINKAYPMTDFKFWLKKKNSIETKDDDKEAIYKRLREISQFGKLPCWNEEKCEINLEKLEQDVLRYMVENQINYQSNLFVSKDNFSKDYLEVYATTNKEIQRLIHLIAMKVSFQTKLAYLRANIHWLSTNIHWNKETMCLDYDRLRADIVRGLEAFAKEGKTKAQPSSSEGHLLVRDIILFENVDSCEQFIDAKAEISKAFPFDFNFGWDWSNPKN